MINIKPTIYAALGAQFDNASDGYPTDWATFPAVQYTEEENRPHTVTDGAEQLTYLRYRIDIWHNESTSTPAATIDTIMTGIGFRRAGAADAPDPSGLRHKVLRYEALVDAAMTYIYSETTGGN